jgi:hypothetical protein
MLEIYSEVVRDLLNPSKDRKQGLQIRQDPKNGFYRTIRFFHIFILIRQMKQSFHLLVYYFEFEQLI